MTSTFEYQPISQPRPEIRLLRIPPQSRGRIPLSLFHVSLTDAPSFIALSYCWLGQPRDRPVTVNDKQLYITESLLTALLNLPSRTKAIHLWADAICINQTDEQEKTQQVQLMRDIYSTADQVLIWLGPGTEETNEAMQGIRDIGDRLLATGLLDVIREKTTTFVQWFMQADDESSANGTRRRIIEIMAEYRQKARDGINPFWWMSPELREKPWFRRVWCVQECVNARSATLRCGDAQVSYEQVQAACWFYRLLCLFLTGSIQGHTPDSIAMKAVTKTYLTYNGPVPSTILDLRQRSRHNSDFTLRHLLGLTHVTSLNVPASMEATDDRDRVYGLLGVATDGAVRELTPDYKLSCQEVYIRTAHVLLKHGHWDILSLCRGPRRQYSLPSWVPDWSSLMEEPWSLAVSTPEQDYDACGPLTHQPGFHISPSDNADTLHLTAVRIDTISKTGSLYSPSVSRDWDWPALMPYFRDLQSYLAISSNITPPQKQEAEWRIPVADTQFTAATKHYTRAPASSHMAAGYARAKDVHGWYQGGIPQTDFEEVRTKCLPVESPYTCYINQVSRMSDTRPFVSETGFVGLCPPETEVGDVIFVFAGVGLPYVARRVGGCWKLVGESYVHGIMDGEAINEDTKTETVTLR